MLLKRNIVSVYTCCEICQTEECNKEIDVHNICKPFIMLVIREISGIWLLRQCYCYLSNHFLLSTHKIASNETSNLTVPLRTPKNGCRLFVMIVVMKLYSNSRAAMMRGVAITMEANVPVSFPSGLVSPSANPPRRGERMHRISTIGNMKISNFEEKTATSFLKYR